MFPKKNLNVITFVPCRGPSPSSVSSALKIWKPLPAEALPTRPAAPEPPVGIPTAAEITRFSTAAPGIQRWLSKPGLQARCHPPHTAPAPCARAQHLPTGRRVQEASTTPPPSQVSTSGSDREGYRVGMGVGGTQTKEDPLRPHPDLKWE